jgi:acetyl-CoA/propionyl-CoA carboxylase biotin carboxyl carrier protein
MEEHNTAAVDGPWLRRDGWRLGVPAPRMVSLGTPGGGVASVYVQGSATSTDVTVAVGDGPHRRASLQFRSRNDVMVTLDGVDRIYRLAPASTGPTAPARDNQAPGVPDGIFLGNEGWSCRLEVLTREARLARVLAAIEKEEGAADPAVRSPMPGTVVSVSVNNGDAVTAGQVLLAVEAMKMEHQLVAPLDGTVHISAGTGDLVKADQVLATVHPAHTGEPSKAEDTIEEAVIAMGAAD